MTKLQILLIGMSFVFMVFSRGIYKRKKIWFLTFLFFFLGALFVGVVSLDIRWLDAIGLSFGLRRGSELLVYVSIMVLFYLELSSSSSQATMKLQHTALVRQLSIRDAIGHLGKSKMVFVIPAYNESNACIAVIQSVLDEGHGVIFVDDGSQNGLFAQLQQHFAGVEELVLIQHLHNLGQGAALQTGFDYILQQYPQAEYVVTFDSDGQHLLSDLPTFQKAFEADPDLEIALGSRFLGSTVNMPSSKKIALKIWILVTFFFGGLRLTDTHNGYRMMKTATLRKIRLTFNGMEHASEILEIIGQQKIRYQEVPNTILYTEYSMARGQKLSNSLKIVKNLLVNKFFH